MRIAQYEANGALYYDFTTGGYIMADATAPGSDPAKDSTKTSVVSVPAPAPTAANALIMATVGELTKLAQYAGDAGEHEAASDLGGHVVSALQQLSEKPGVKTTEFYVALLAKLAGGYLIVQGGSDLKAAIGAGLIAAATLAYNLSRGIAKKAVVAGMLLVACVSIGCAPVGYVAVADIEPLTIRCLDRHDAYVKTGIDPTGKPMTVDQVGTALDSSAILRKLIAEAKKPPAATPAPAAPAPPKCPLEDGCDEALPNGAHVKWLNKEHTVGSMDAVGRTPFTPVDPK